MIIGEEFWEKHGLPCAFASRQTLRERLNDLCHWMAERAEPLGLTKYATPAEILTHALAPTFALLPHLDDARPLTIAEIGPGSGVQGLALAVLYPDHHLLMVERRRRAVSFLELTRARFALENVSVQQVDCRELAKDRPGTIDVVMFRALATAESALPLVRDLLRSDGFVAAWHRSGDSAFVHPPAGWRRLLTEDTSLPRLDMSLLAPA